MTLRRRYYISRARHNKSTNKTTSMSTLNAISANIWLLSGTPEMNCDKNCSINEHKNLNKFNQYLELMLFVLIHISVN